jgi:hypothetical protein
MINPADILAEHGQVFDEYQQEIDDLEELPYEDEDDNPINIYDADGNIIDRKTLLYRDSEAPGGILLKLDNVHTMFNRIYGNHRQSDPHRTGRVVTKTYPQAFMTSFGHVQSDTVFPEFHQTAHSINERLLSRRRPHGNLAEDNDSGGNDDDDDDYFPSSSSEDHDHDDRMLSPSAIDAAQEVQGLMQQHAVEPVKGIFFQAYNLLQHRIARRSGDAETMHGTVTAALAGHHAQPHERATAERLQSYLEIGMPFERMKEKLISVTYGPPTDLRMENYWTVNFTGIAKEKRNGQ